jgi:hypothetical protein
LPYLVTNDANISSFAKDFKLYGINCKTKPPFMVSTHSLYHLLHVTSSFHLEDNGDQGVLYWLGMHTDTKIHTQRFTSWLQRSLGILEKTMMMESIHARHLRLSQDLVISGAVSSCSQGHCFLPAIPCCMHKTCYLLFCEHNEVLNNPVVIDLKHIQFQLSYCLVLSLMGCQLWHDSLELWSK